MRLDENTTPDGKGKYALIKQRRVREILAGPAEQAQPVSQALQVLAEAGVLEETSVGGDGEFFVIRLRDRHSTDALNAYARSAELRGHLELADDVAEMARRSGVLHEGLKDPD